ncbi:hypothetical protein ACPEIC_38815 [Stenotrophomonas sp. NPDC087984]
MFAIVYSYRKQKIEEASSHRADADSLGTRYQDAAEQLGNESAPVRLAGIYALARLADEDSSQRETICRLFCAYLRMPYDPSTSLPGEREVRFTVIKVISEHLQDPAIETSWCGFDLDFSGAVFDGGSFAGAHFVNAFVSFAECRFVDGKVQFDRAVFEDVDVSFGSGEDAPTVFDGGYVHFIDARFKAGASVSFIFADFRSGSVEFGSSEFQLGSVVTFSSCVLRDAFLSFGGPIWVGAKFMGGRVGFEGAHLQGGALSFIGAEFAGSHVSMNDVDVTKTTILFDDASFESGSVTFNDSRIYAADIRFGSGAAPEGIIHPWPLPGQSGRFGRRARRLYGWRFRIVDAIRGGTWRD